MSRPRARLAPIGNLLINLASGVWLGCILSLALNTPSIFDTLQRLRPPVDRPVYVANSLLVDQFAGLLAISTAAWFALMLGLVLATVSNRRLPWARTALAFVALVLLAWLWHNGFVMVMTHFHVHLADNTDWSAEMIAEVQTVFDNAYFTSEVLLLVVALTQVGVLAITAWGPSPSLGQVDEPA